MTDDTQQTPAAVMAAATLTAGASLTVDVSKISIGTNWAVTWLNIASQAVADARAARAKVDSNAEPQSWAEPLAAEHYASLVGIVAASFAVEAAKIARYGDVKLAATVPDLGRKPQAGDFIGWQLVDEGKGDATLATEIGELFELRHASVHPVNAYEPTAPHPSGVGTWAGLTMNRYSLETAERLLKAAEQAVMELLDGAPPTPTPTS